MGLADRRLGSVKVGRRDAVAGVEESVTESVYLWVLLGSDSSALAFSASLLRPRVATYSSPSAGFDNWVVFIV
jgi:hypothetical protein